MLKSVAGNQRIYLGCFISLLLFLLVGHFSTLALQKNKQLAFSKNLLIKSDEVTLQLATSLRAVNQAALIECNKPTIDKIRIIASYYPYVDDIGIAEGDKLLCTANWGILEKQSQLPRHDFITASGVDVYLTPRDLFPSPLIRNMPRLAHVVAFSSRLRAEQIYKDTADFSYELVTKNGEHKFISLAGSPAASNHFSTLSTRLCSDTFDYCIVTYNDSVGILAYQPLLIALYCVIALCFGGLIAFSITSYQEEKRSLEFRLIRAIKREELYLEYQPVVHAVQHHIVGVEALLRWKDELYGQVSPELFIPIATKLALYKHISFFIAHRALHDLQHLLKQDSNLMVSLNISNYEITKPEYLDYLHKQVILHDIKPHQIKLEITERINEYHQKISEFAIAARKKGFKVSLDDFGTGASNIVWLTSIDFDEIKLDKIFIHGLHEELKRDLFISMLNGIAKLNKQLVFEGVESPHELRLIESFDKHAFIQGWLFYKALPAARLTHIIAEKRANSSPPPLTAASSSAH